MQGREIHSTPSIGIALVQGAQPSAQDLLQRADLAMYQAKAGGRNTLCFFDPAMQAAASARSALEGDIRLALQRNEFLLHYQPVVNEQGEVMAQRHWCAGCIRSAAWFRPASSFRWPSRPG